MVSEGTTSSKETGICVSRSVNKEPELIFDLTSEPLVPDDKYEFVYASHKYVPSFGGNSKLFMWFRITSLGEHHGKELLRFYNVRVSNKRYRPPRNGLMTREMRQLFGNSLKARGLPLQQLKGSVLLGITRTVSTDSRQKKLHSINRYSVIDQLVRVI